MQTIEQDTSERSVPETFRRVLVLVDFDALSHRAVQVAAELRRRFGAEVCAFHVARSDENDHFLNALGSPITRSDLIEEGSAELREFVRDVEPEVADVIECDARPEEDYVRTVLAKVHEWAPSLIVVSREHPHALLRTHTEKLVKSLELPVLLLEPPQE